MKSRSLDGSQFQYRYAVVEVTRPRPTFQSRLTDAAAEILVGLPARVGIRQTIERVVARRRVVEIRDDLRPLPIGRTERRRHTCNHLRIPFRALPRVIHRHVDGNRFRRRHEQLASETQLFSVFVSACVVRVVDEPVTPAAGERDTSGYLVTQRTRERGLGLDEVVAAICQLDVRLAARTWADDW